MATKTTKTETKSFGKREAGHWGITKGSRKEEVSIHLAKKGKAYAIDKGKDLGLKESTIRSWINHWVRAGLLGKDDLKERHKARVKAKVQQAEQQSTAAG